MRDRGWRARRAAVRAASVDGGGTRLGEDAVARRLGCALVLVQHAEEARALRPRRREERARDRVGERRQELGLVDLEVKRKEAEEQLARVAASQRKHASRLQERLKAEAQSFAPKLKIK